MKSRVSSRLTSESGSARETCSSALAIVGVFQRLSFCSSAGLRTGMDLFFRRRGRGRRTLQEIKESILRTEQQVADRVVPVDDGGRGRMAREPLGMHRAHVLEHPAALGILAESAQ